MPSPDAEPAVVELLRDLARRPVLLWALAFLGNALWMPYVGIKQDACLYAAQTIDAYDGRFHNDLFFAFGSQSKYTLFPQLLAAVYAVLGIDWTFFLGSVASTAVLIAAVIAFLRRLLGPVPTLPPAVLWCACCPVLCADGGTFLVNEQFLTARPLAAALGLFALERLLAGRWLSFLALTAGALVVHPLIAAPVALIGGATAVARAGRYGWGVVGVATAFGVGLLAVPGLPVKVFGPMSEVWRGQVIAAMPFHHPINWAATDWLRLGVAAVAALLFVRSGRGAIGTTLAGAAVLVAGVGVLLTTYAAECEGRLLFQGQPYRWVWPLEVLRGPLVLAVVARFWPGGGALSRAGYVALFVAAAGFPVVEGRLALFAVVVGSAAGYAAIRLGSWPVWRAVVLGAVAALVVPDLLHLAQVVHANRTAFWDLSLEWEIRAKVTLEQVGALPRVASVLALAALARRPRVGSGLAVATSVAAAWAVQWGFWEVSQSRWAKETFLADWPDVRFVEAYLGEVPPRRSVPPAARPSVYMAGVRPKWVWFDLDCDSYLMRTQVSGITFSEAGAAECFRRGRLVLPFESALAPDDVAWEVFRGDGPPAREPTRVDFQALAAEPGVDLLVLRQEFPGSAATNGRVYIYDLRASRRPGR